VYSFYAHYDVNVNSPLPVVDRDGLPIPTNYVAVLSCAVTGTNAPGASMWMIKRWPDGSVSIQRLADFAELGSNTPQIYNDAGLVRIRLFAHPQTYTVRCHTSRIN
jgi:hypothetical protein